MSTYPPRWKNPHRPYAYRSKVPSITAVIDAMGGKKLEWGASKETSREAILNAEKYAGMDPDEAIETLRRHFKGVWDGRAAMGTLVHAVNEAWCHGEEADVEALVHEYATVGGPASPGRKPSPVRIWQGHEARVIEEANGYIDGLERFWQDFQPQTIATEEVVRTIDKGGHSFIGTRDWVATLNGFDGPVIIEAKTTAQQLDEKSKPGDDLYLDSWRLQLAAQRGAKEIVHYDDKGNEVATYPNYPVSACAVLHLRGSGHYQFIEVRAAGDELAHFLRLIDIKRWLDKGCKEPAPIDRTIYLAMEEVA